MEPITHLSSAVVTLLLKVSGAQDLAVTRARPSVITYVVPGGSFDQHVEIQVDSQDQVPLHVVEQHVVNLDYRQQRSRLN